MRIKFASVLLQEYMRSVGELTVGEKRAHAVRYARRCRLEVTEGDENHVDPIIEMIIAAATQGDQRD